MAQKNTHVKASDISADRPITSAKDDLLGRKPFAAGLAKRIAAWDASESLVTALCGEWGCGKTSLKNMVIDELHKQNPNIKVMEFCPWEISGHHSLTASFFRDLSVTIAPPANADQKQQAAAKRLKTYAQWTSFGSAALSGISLAMAPFGVPVGGVVRLIGDCVKATGEVAQAGAVLENNETEPPSLADVKRDLIAHMARLSHPILIVIDDIDRLTTEEIREVFQLVKANANFPNLIYLLLFDREVVSGALDAVSGSRGNQFLDKIVQVLFNVPQPTLPDVHGVLLSGLNRCLSQSGIDTTLDEDRWSRIWLEGLAPYFTNLRCVYRFLSSFAFHVSQMRNGKTFELNFVDLIALEVLRLFESAFYEALPGRSDALTGVNKHRFPNEAEGNKERDEIRDQLLSLASEDHRKRLLVIVRTLFPALFNPQYQEGSLLRHLRVGHKDVFDRYFTMSIASNDIAQADVNALHEALSHPLRFTKLCKSLIRRDKLKQAIQRLNLRADELDILMLPKAVQSLIDAADFFPYADKTDNFATSTLDFANHFIRSSLLNIYDKSERSHLLYSGIRDSTGLLLAVRLVAVEARRPGNPNREWMMTAEHWTDIQSIVLDRIREYANDGRIKSLPKLNYVLWKWKDWAGEPEVSAWVKSFLHTGKDALWALRTFMSTGSRSDNKVTFKRYIILSDLSLFCDIERLSQLTEGYTLEKLEIEDKRALRAFRYSLKCRDEGKPDTYCRDGNFGIKELEEED